MSEPRILLEWEYTPDPEEEDATPEKYRLRKGRCGQRPLVEWRNQFGDWVSGSGLAWIEEATVAVLVRLVERAERLQEVAEAVEGALDMYTPAAVIAALERYRAAKAGCI